MSRDQTVGTHEPIAAPPPEGVPGLRSARRLLQRRLREQSRQWLVEGPQAVAEALAVPGLVRRLFLTAELAARRPDLTPAGVELVEVEPAALATLSETVTPQGVVAVVRAPAPSLAEALAGDPRLVVLAGQVRDPGNAGTLIRCADAFGADAVVLTRGSVELGNPKLLRASVGSVFHLPVVTGVDLAEAVAGCRQRGLAVLAADGAAGTGLDQLQREGRLARPTAWLMGNEAWGLPPADAALADATVGVPLWGAAESLNLATAAAVCLYTTAAAQRAAG